MSVTILHLFSSKGCFVINYYLVIHEHVHLFTDFFCLFLFVPHVTDIIGNLSTGNIVATI
jgi:hypothetical protein